MAGREDQLNWRRWATSIGALLALVSVVTIGLAMRRAAAERLKSGNSTMPVAARLSPAGGPSSLRGRTFPLDVGTGSAIVGEFEGRFDAATGSFTIQPRVLRKTDFSSSDRSSMRSLPSEDVPPGIGFGLTVLNNAFVNSGDNPPTVSSEIQITNNTNLTLLNTRLVFTTFKIGSATGPDAGNLPGENGFAYFNDGQIPFDGKLNVSRFYGDIPAGGSAQNIWSFAVANSPPAFYFALRVLADPGVAAESIQPAAVQVNDFLGTSVLINGRGFAGTPTVELIPGIGVPIAMSNVSATATQITGTIPAGTSPGVYNVRVTNQGGGGSSMLVGRLTVTGVPDGDHTISGNLTSLNDAGPYLILGDVTINSVLTIPAGAVFYVADGGTLTISNDGNLIAHGGIPGIPGDAVTPAPSQIVFTAQRTPGTTIPAAGSWGGINARSASTAEMVMRNLVIEYGGASGSGQIDITGSGRTLRFTDSISRRSAGAGIAAGGPNDSLIGFTRNRIEGNGSNVNDPAVRLSGNAALGLYDIDRTTGGTSVGAPSYYYSSANDFAGNQINVIQIGTDDDAASNDFTKSGVLVGQLDTPLRIRGSRSNPAIVGAASPQSAELAINATAIIHLAPGMDLQAGDYPSNRVGGLAANGYAGVYLGAQEVTSNRLIDFDKIPGSDNFGAIFFARNALPNSILNYVRVRGGGASQHGHGEVIVEALNLKVTNSQISNSSTGGLLELLSAVVETKGTSLSGNAQLIDTLAGGPPSEGSLGLRANLVTPVAIAIDPGGRGIYLVDAPSGVSSIRFLNTTRQTVTVAGRQIPGGVIRTIAGGGVSIGENVPGMLADLGLVTGIAAGPNGDLVYFIDSSFPAIRALNVSDNSKTIAGGSIDAGNIGTFAKAKIGPSITGLAVNPVNGEIYLVDATAGINKVFKFGANLPSPSSPPTLVAGNGAPTKANDVFPGGPATTVPLLQPRALVPDSSGNLYLADTGHARVIKVEPNGIATLVAQFPPKSDPSAKPYTNNPYPSGLAFFNGKVLIANGNAQDVSSLDVTTNPAGLALVAGTIGSICDYTSSVCGDGGTAKQAGFSLIGSSSALPLAGIAADGKGAYILDQGANQRGRVRYINLSEAAVEVAGVVIAPGNIDTVAGTGQRTPFDSGLAAGAELSVPLGVAVDSKGNLWIADTLSGRLRFVNRESATVRLFAGTPAQQDVLPGTVISVNKDVGAGPTDNVSANQAGFDLPQGIVVTSDGVYLCDSQGGPATMPPNSRRTGLIRFINTSSRVISFYEGGPNRIDVSPGNVATIAGGGKDQDLSNPGDGSNPLGAKFIGPSDLAIAPNGDLYVADAGQRRVRKIVRATGTVSSLNLSNASPNEYTGLAFDSAGRLLIANAGSGQILREITAGSGSGFDQILSGGLLSRPRDVVEGRDGNLYVTNAGDSSSNAGDHRIIKIALNGSSIVALVLAGSTTPGYAGDGGFAVNALINITTQPINVASFNAVTLVRTTVNIAVGPNGEIIFTDSLNNAIRRIR